MSADGGASRRVLLLGGEETRFHQFDLVIPPLRERLEERGCDVRIGVGAHALVRDNLVDRDLIISITTGGTLSKVQERALLDAVSAPHNDRGRPVHFVGLHGASASFAKSDAYLEMLGGRFVSHPEIREFELRIEIVGHPLTANLAPNSIEDEQYVIELRSAVEVLVTSLSPELTTPSVWTKRHGLGKVVYCALGHDAPQLRHPFVLALLDNALRWCVR